MFRKENKVEKRISLDRSILEHDYLYKKENIFNNSRITSELSDSPVKFRHFRNLSPKFQQGLRNRTTMKSTQFEEYKKEHTSMLKNYKLNSIGNNKYSINSSILNSSSPEISKFMGVYKTISFHLENSMININALEEDYKSPVESFIVLDQNKKIFEKVVNNASLRLKQKFEEESEKQLELQRINYKRVKVTNVAPKNIDILNVHEKNNCNFRLIQ
jgi:hypothetical protein